MKYFFQILLTFSILSCTGGKNSVYRTISIERASIQELVAGVEGGGSTYNFIFQFENIQTKNDSIILLFNGKESKLFSMDKKGEFSANVHFTQKEKMNISSYSDFELKKAIIYFSSIDSVEVNDLVVLETQYLP